MGDYNSCLGAMLFVTLTELPSVAKSSDLSGSSWQYKAGYGAGHLVVRAAVPQGANVRQAANSWGLGQVPKGGDYPAFLS
jgi:hypothetical protein